MRQTLLRVRLDDLWSLQPVDGITAVGVGYLLLAWTLISVGWWAVSMRKTGWKTDQLPSLVFWLLGTGFAFAAPLWAPKVTSSFPIFGYGFSLLVGFFVGGWTASRRAQREGLNGDIMWDLGIWIFFAGLLGARLFYLGQYHDRVFADKQGLAEYVMAAVNLPDGGVVLFGGVFLGLAAYLTFCFRRRQRPLVLGDILVPSFFIGLAFGRFGCFLNGCCYGDHCTLPWAVTFPHGSVPFAALVARGFLSPDAAASLPLHPTQLYSVMNAFVLAFLTAMCFRHRRCDGAVLALALIVYPFTRIVIETLRGDEMGQFGTGLTISQLLSCGVMAVGIGLGAWCWAFAPKRPGLAGNGTTPRNESAGPVPA